MFFQRGIFFSQKAVIEVKVLSQFSTNELNGSNLSMIISYYPMLERKMNCLMTTIVTRTNHSIVSYHWLLCITYGFI